MMSPSSAPSQYDEKHRSVLKKIEKDRKEAQEVRRRCQGLLRSNDADGNENVKKTKCLISKTTTLHVHHAFLYISFLFLHDFDVKLPNFAF